MPRCTQLCLSPIKSLFSIPCKYCLDGVSLPATVNARKPQLSKWRLSLLHCKPHRSDWKNIGR
ncbi:hypothetical protein FQN60_004591 [Etheostoma spectabile]|uniref:Uncharacterized protein n=1 Tax=Etheostoma spectabile TaxID=54343 RepID=A0A5J5DK25_9PERO|nr:hypothetical protein FQN60_004591 [Etheostoma spectabile]